MICFKGTANTFLSKPKLIKKLIFDLLELSSKLLLKSFTINLDRLRPEEYNLEIIDDTNKNGRWDPVNWWLKTQAEKVKKFKIDGLKENWSIDKEIKYAGG